jgi:hypothetical protein
MIVAFPSRTSMAPSAQDGTHCPHPSQRSSSILIIFLVIFIKFPYQVAEKRPSAALPWSRIVAAYR